MFGEVLLANLLKSKGAISELPKLVSASHESDKHKNFYLGLWRQKVLIVFGYNDVQVTRGAN